MKAPNVLLVWSTVAFIRAALVAGGLSLAVAESAWADRLIGATRFTGELIDIIASEGDADPGVPNQLKRVAVTPASICRATVGGPFAEDGKIKAMARQPTTGTIYGIARGNLLMTIDPATGTINYVASIPGLSTISSITFTTSDQLFAIVGGADSAGGVAGSIHRIDLTTGVPTPTGLATRGKGGHAIAYNSNDQRIYHFYSSGGAGQDPDRLEKINPIDRSSRVVNLTGDSFMAVNGLVFTGSVFYGFDNGDENDPLSIKNVISITPTGVVSVSSNPGVNVQALEWDSPSLIAVDNINKTVFRLNPETGAQSDVMAFLPFACPPSLYSIARDRDTDTYYVIIDSDYPNIDHADTLVTIDVDTGVRTKRDDPLTENHIAGITVGPGSRIYGVMGKGNETLGGGTIVRIDKVNGTVTDTGWLTTKGTGGQSLEFNPDDGMLYHFFDDPAKVAKTKLEKIDPDTGAITMIGALTPRNARSIIGVVYRGFGRFYAVDNRNLGGSYPLYDITTDGNLTFLGGVDTTTSGLELVPDSASPVDPDAARMRRQIEFLRKKFRKAKRKRQNARARRLGAELRKRRNEFLEL